MRLPEMDTIPTDHREFIGATSIEVGYGAEATDSRFFEYKAENGQRVGVYETKPKSLEAELTDHVRRPILLRPVHCMEISCGTHG